jgi:hypothetical protein
MRFVRTNISEALSRRSLYLSTLKQIELTRELYFLVSIPEAEVKLISLSGDSIQRVTLSIDDTKQIFNSIEHAYNHREFSEIQLGDFWWKTDCHVPSDPGKVTISFKRGWQRTRTDLRRQDVAAAITSFRDLFKTE